MSLTCIEILRRALPAGLAATAATGTATRGLAAVRTVVLEAVTRAAPPVTTAAALGGLLVMKKLLLIPVGLLAARALAWMAWPETPPTPQTAHTAPPGAQVAGLETPTVPDTPTPAARNTEAMPSLSRQELDVPTTPAAGATVTLRGRCVDADTGLPLAGCVIELEGRPGTPERLAAHEKLHGEVKWEDPADLSTGPDGTFSFTFAPLPPYDYSLTIHKEGRVSMTGNWYEMESGTVVDAGDIALTRGLVVTGQVVDQAGVAQSGVDISAQVVDRSRDGIYSSTFTSARTSPQGSFEFRDRIGPGSWRLSISGRQVVDPNLVIPDHGQLDPITVVVKDPVRVETITGTVVDERGIPVAGADVTFGHDPSASSGRAHSSRDGTFTIKKGRGAFSEDVLYVDRLGYEFLVTEERYSWGASDVTLTLAKGQTVEVLVLDSETGGPVEEYGVRCYVEPLESGRWMSTEAEVQQSGHHENGLARIPGVRKGTNLLVIESPHMDYLRSRVHLFHMTEAGLPCQVIRMQRTVWGEVEVVTPEGHPLPGVPVELIRTPGEAPLPLEKSPSPLGNIFQGDIPTVLFEGKTDQDGHVTLAAPSGEKLALRLPGPGHAPRILNGFVLEPTEEPHRVTVEPGATLRIRLGPLDILKDPYSKANSAIHPGIRLYRPTGNPTVFPLSQAFVAPDEDGNVEIEHIPSGTWELAFSPRSFDWKSYHMLTLKNLQEGEDRVAEIDVSRFEKGTLNATLFLNGHPLAGATVWAEGIAIDPRGEQVTMESSSQTTSDSGKLLLSLIPAIYRLQISLSSAGS